MLEHHFFGSSLLEGVRVMLKFNWSTTVLTVNSVSVVAAEAAFVACVGYFGSTEDSSREL